jgi:hypothetical protein
VGAWVAWGVDRDRGDAIGGVGVWVAGGVADCVALTGTGAGAGLGVGWMVWLIMVGFGLVTVPL